MAQWGNNDNAANSVSWAITNIKSTYNAANTSATQTTLFANTSASEIITNGMTVGQFGVDANELSVDGGVSGVPHTGWVLRTVGTGGRAGRVQHEVLVAGGIETSNVADDPVFPDV